MVSVNGSASTRCQFTPVYISDVTIPERLIDHLQPVTPSQVILKEGFLINNGVCVETFYNQSPVGDQLG